MIRTESRFLSLSTFRAAAAVCAAVVCAAAGAEEGEGAKVTYDRDIRPIFEARCFECHGADSQKGDLRLDSQEAINRGGTFGPVIVAGKPDESTLYQLITLPSDDPDFMPASGAPLTDEQVALIRQWIEQGVSFERMEAPEGEAAAESAAQFAKPQPNDQDRAQQVLLALAQDVPAPPTPEVLAAVRDRGALAMPLDQKLPLIRVDFQLAGGGIGDGDLEKLAALAPHVTWLNLAGTGVTDAGLAHLKPLKKLTRLHLEKTGITDAGLAHLNGLEHLEYLNLYGTQVTDAGLEHLKALKSLRKLYLWQSGATEAGAAALQEALPELDINLGVQAPAETAEEPAQTGVPGHLVALFDAEGCCAKAQGNGAACDHPCCVEAAGKGELCAKCNPNGAKKAELAKQFTADGCCAKAFADGKACDHPCCIEAAGKGEVCTKCNPAKA